MDVDIEQLLPGASLSPPPPAAEVSRETSLPTSSLDPSAYLPPSNLTHCARNQSSRSSVHNPGLVYSEKAAMEKESGPVTSYGHVRILHFDIRLPLPSDSGAHNTCSESFTFPETESVGSLKRHFIQLRLTELTLLATSSEWSEHITEVTPNTLLAHLHFDSTGPHSFTDNSVRLGFSQFALLSPGFDADHFSIFS